MINSAQKWQRATEGLCAQLNTGSWAQFRAGLAIRLIKCWRYDAHQRRAHRCVSDDLSQ